MFRENKSALNTSNVIISKFNYGDELTKEEVKYAYEKIANDKRISLAKRNEVLNKLKRIYKSL